MRVVATFVILQLLGSRAACLYNEGRFDLIITQGTKKKKKIDNPSIIREKQNERATKKGKIITG